MELQSTLFFDRSEPVNPQILFSPASVIRRMFHHLLVNILFPIAKVRVNVTGSFPEQGSFIVAANHASHLDTAVILKTLSDHNRARLTISASRNYFFESKNLFHRLAVALFNLVPATGHDLIAAAHRIKRTEEILLIYPEGTRSRTGKIAHFCNGIGKIHHESGVPIVPVTIIGTSKLMPVGSRWARAGKIEIIIAEPMISHSLDSAVISDCVEQIIRKNGSKYFQGEQS